MILASTTARAPLTQSRFTPLPAGAILSGGSARDELIALRAGLLSRCAHVFPENSAWLGGDLPGGIAAANYLEACALTAALLGDCELESETMRLVRGVARAQREDGSFGAPGESFAARGRMLRAVSAAFSASGERELLVFLIRYMKYLQLTLADAPLSEEDAMHTADTLEACRFLYEVTGQKALLGVAEALFMQGADYASLLSTFPHRRPISQLVSEEDLRAAMESGGEDSYNRRLLRTADAANLCEGLRTSALIGVFTGSGKHIHAPEIGLARFGRFHGAVNGGVTGDPLLAGRDASRGVTAISVSELAASLETLLSCPEGEYAADPLEILCYNALAAAFAPDKRSVQPIQQVNQRAVCPETRFPMSDSSSILFGLTDSDALSALLGAAARFLQHQWMLSSDGGLCAMGYAPVSVRYRLSGASVRIDVESSYPTSGSVRIRVHTRGGVAFPLTLRIPEWAQDASAAIDGETRQAKPGSFLTLNREWQDGDEILLRLPMRVRTIPCMSDRAACVKRGPVVYACALPHEERRNPDGTALFIAKDGAQAALVKDAPLLAEETEAGVRVLAQLRIDGKTLSASLSPYAQTVVRQALFTLE